MARIKTTQRIYDVTKDIRNEMYKLPSIQRSFVWEQERIYKLMDSLMNDYPIGSFLVWKPSGGLKVRTRRFILDYRTGSLPFVSEEESLQSSPHLVLDGQQRFQSMYIGFFGSYDGKHLYFKLDSNPEKEENDLRYEFQFLKSEQAERDQHWARPAEIVGLNIEEIPEFVSAKFEGDTDDRKRRISKNLGKFIRVFNIDEKISIQEVKEDLQCNDVLEVFVRVNSGGMVLTKSDLVFSTIVLSSPDMEGNFIQLVDESNGRGEYDFDIDFIIKASFVVFGKGAKYDVDKLRDRDYIGKLNNRFEDLKKSFLSTMEFLKTDAKILSKRFLKSELALIPIIDFIFRQPHQQLTDGQALQLRQYLYMSFFTKFYSYGADGKLDVIYKKISGNTFPTGEIGRYMTEKMGVNYEFSKMMLNDLDLVLNIIQDGVAEIPKKRGWSLEKDHIFSQHFLEGKNVSEELVNSVGNLRLINKTRNILKGDRLPDDNIEFFGSDDSGLKHVFLATKGDFTVDNFRSFVQGREELIFSKVKTFLGFGA